MKAMYGRVYQLSRSEAFAVFAISFGVVVAYSVWGAYLIHTKDTSLSPQVATVAR